MTNAATDTNPANNYSELNFNLCPLSISATGTTSAPYAGDLAYTVTVTNNGSTAASNVSITDSLPGQVLTASNATGNISCVNAPNENGGVKLDAGVCAIPSIAAGASVTATFHFTTAKPFICSASSVSNTASVSVNGVTNSADPVTTQLTCRNPLLQEYASATSKPLGDSDGQEIIGHIGDTFDFTVNPYYLTKGYTSHWNFDGVLNNACVSGTQGTNGSTFYLTCNPTTTGIGKVSLSVTQNGQTYTSNQIVATVTSLAAFSCSQSDCKTTPPAQFSCPDGSTVSLLCQAMNGTCRANPSCPNAPVPAFTFTNANLDPNGSMVPTGVTDFLKLRINSTVPTDLQKTVFGGLVFNVTATNVQMDASQFTLFNASNTSDTVTGTVYNPDGTLYTGRQVTGSFLVVFQPPASGSISVNPGSSSVVVVRGNITNPQINGTLPSALQGSLTHFSDTTAQSFDVSHSHVFVQYIYSASMVTRLAITAQGDTVTSTMYGGISPSTFTISATGPSSAQTRQNATYTVTAKNTSTVNGTNVLLLITSTPGSYFVTGSDSRCGVYPGGDAYLPNRISCGLGTVAPGTSITVTPQFTLVGINTVTASVSADGMQPVSATPVTTQISSSSSSSFSSSGPSQSPIGYWPLDDKQGPTAADASGNGATGAVSVGITAGVPGKVGTAFQFGGAAYAAVNTNPSQAFAVGTGDFTVSLWMQSTDIPKYRGLFTPNGDPQSSGIYLYVNDNGNLRTWVAGSGPFIGNIKILNDSKNADRWVHILVERKGGVLTQYVNGVLDGTFSAPGAVKVQNLSFGGSQFGYLGKLDDIRFYNRALSDNEIAALSGVTCHLDLHSKSQIAGAAVQDATVSLTFPNTTVSTGSYWSGSICSNTPYSMTFSIPSGKTLDGVTCSYNTGGGVTTPSASFCTLTKQGSTGTVSFSIPAPYAATVQWNLH